MRPKQTSMKGPIRIHSGLGVAVSFRCHVNEDICVVCFSLGLEHISPQGNDRIAGVMCCKVKPSEVILLLSSL